VSRHKFLDVPGCLRSKLTVWKEEQFTVLSFQGIEQRKKRVAEWVVKVLHSVNPGVWGCVQAQTQWSPEEDTHMRPGHHRGTLFYNKDSALVIKRWFNRVEEDVSGLTFQEWTPDVDTSRPPVSMLINSSELRSAGFKFKEVLPPALEAVAHVLTRGAGL
jgi:hypothetical protein